MSVLPHPLSPNCIGGEVKWDSRVNERRAQLRRGENGNAVSGG